MKWPEKLIFYSFLGLFGLVPLVFLPNTSELFEFNKITLTYLLTCIIGFAWASRCLIEKRRIFHHTLLDIPLLIFLGAQALSLVFSIDPHISWFGYYGRWNGGLLSLGVYAFLYWAAVSNLHKAHLKPLISVAITSATVCALFGILEHFGIDAHIWYQDVQNRVFSTLGQPNWLAAYLIALIFIPLPVLFTAISSNKKKGIWIIETLLLLCLIFTKSRSGLIAFGIGAVVFWYVQLFDLPFKLKATKTELQTAFLSLLGAVVLILTINNPVKDALLGKVIPVASEPVAVGPALETGGTESTAIRKIVWTGALRVWQQSPNTLLLGTGPETFALTYYKFRPIEHNNTSEWELLYNKAHNEYLNYLSTTGLLGLGTYVVLLAAMVIMMLRTHTSNNLFTPSLLAGWVTIIITNAPGFSVVVVQLLLFLLPALAVIQTRERTTSSIAHSSDWRAKTGVVILAGIACYLAYQTGRYWLADTHYSIALKAESAFTRSGNVQAVIDGYDAISQAFDLNPDEPVINMQFGSSAAYVAVLSTDVDATASAKLATLADQMTARAVALSPASPSLLKTQARALIFLSALDPAYLTKADAVLSKAQTLSPTDPRLPYNRGVIAKYARRYDQAVNFFTLALQLKPDFGDAQSELSEVATLSAKIKP